MTQFPEHKEGKTSTNPKVQKLHKLAKSMHVMIHIDGVPYGEVPETVTPVTAPETVSEYIGQHTIVENYNSEPTITEQPDDEPVYSGPIDGLNGDPGLDGNLGLNGYPVSTETETLSIEDGDKLLAEILPTQEVDVTDEFVEEKVEEKPSDDVKVEEKPKRKSKAKVEKQEE